MTAKISLLLMWVWIGRIKKNAVCVQFKNGDRIFHVIEHTPEALDIWLNELHQRVKGRIAIAVS